MRINIKTSETNRNNIRFKELDSLRGIAAISVVFAHLTLSLPLDQNYFRFGVAGVDLFFLISGFVIYMSFEKINKPNEFIIARIGRLYPAYWVAVVYSFLLFFCWSSLTGMPQTFSLNTLVTNLTMVQHYFNKRDIIAPAWTLLIEMLFYIFMLLLFMLKQLHKIENVIIVSVVPIFIYIFYLEKNALQIYYWLNNYFPLIKHLPLFYSGILFYRIKTSKRNFIRFILIGICFVAQIFLFYHGGSDKDFMSQRAFIIILSIFYIVFIGLIVNKLVFINNFITQFLGKISYSLYLIHLLPSVLLISLFTRTKYFHLNFWFVIWVIVLPFILFSSYLLNKLVEVPGIKIAKKILSRYIVAPNPDKI